VRRLLIRPGAIGDCIVSLPALECLRADYTEVWVASPNVALVRFADRVRSIASTGLDLLEIRGSEAGPALLDTLAGFDSIISWYGANREQFRDVTRQLGLPFEFLSPLPPEKAGNREPGAAPVHAVDFYLTQARRFSECNAGAVPRIPCRPSRDEKGFVAIQPFSGSPSKNWPLERYRRLARQLERDVPVEWCAGPEECLPGARRFEDLYELGCWLAGARLYIGNDSGITHLAAAVGTPVVALFGPTDPRVWAPRGKLVRVVAAGRPGASMDQIPVAAVTEAARQLLAGA